VVPTRRRFAKVQFATGPRVDRLRELLLDARVAAVTRTAGERCIEVALAAQGGEGRRLVVELFGNRGVWALVDEGSCVLELSRLPEGSKRVLRPGAPWAPPPPRPGDGQPDTGTPRTLDAIDEQLTAADLDRERTELAQVCAHALDRAGRALEQKLAGLARQIAAAGEAQALRDRADLMSAYAHTVERGAERMVVPAFDDPGQEVEIALDPALPVRKQAEALYRRARKVEDAREVAERRRAEAAAQSGELEALRAELAAAADMAALRAVRDELLRRHWLRPERVREERPRAQRPARADGFRRYRSAEGHDILCGKTNEANDRLSLRAARGNDLWFHIGRGYAGSHVVVRVPKGKTASLETMLDAAHVAAHFSKARGAETFEVVYTFAKHVRKPKGLPPGQVTAAQTKTLHVRLEPDRLRRLLDQAGET
jgi:predicted ribosome quality control (RQC) complex YloA/Tae2 family protein